MQILADECCPRSVVEAMREAGLDVRYAAESDISSSDQELLATANAEGRIIVTEDFDFGDLLFRDRLSAKGVVILFLPTLGANERAERLMQALQTAGLEFAGQLTIVSRRRIRQRALPG